MTAWIFRSCNSVLQKHFTFCAQKYIFRSFKIGEKLPIVSVYEDTPDKKVNLQELFKNKRGVLFSVVGAFTPGCTKSHLPEYLENFDRFKEEGYDLICCISVNDPFVMSAWGKQVSAEGKITMLADPKAEFTKAMNMDLDCTKLLGNVRSKRYCLVIEDGIIKSIMTEPNHTGLACLLCIKNFSKGTRINTEHSASR
ncbi:peroxiredoxin-5, mitochondrial-like [Mytilus californianus]|uniref:peroxiredoxin-5, mitochondrial-like n=1 Tax=Mytilus californianus TaxID=6549 RepID=UPI00224688B8|nr:peroxiredoxin-5, mitochondrial-like [Mytilus californianus]